MRSAMCDRGRKESALSVGYRALAWPRACAVHSRLRWVSMAPLGGPVVPEVYSRMATWSSDALRARRSRPSGSHAARPRARSSSRVRTWGSENPASPSGSMTTMRSRCGSWLRTSRALSSCSSSSTKNTRASLCPRMYAHCSGGLVAYTATERPPARRIPMSQNSHSGRLLPMMAAAWPGWKPRATSPQATSCAARPYSAHVTGCHSPLRLCHRATRGPRSRTARRKCSGTVPVVTCWSSRVATSASPHPPSRTACISSTR